MRVCARAQPFWPPRGGARPASLPHLLLSPAFGRWGTLLPSAMRQTATVHASFPCNRVRLQLGLRDCPLPTSQPTRASQSPDPRNLRTPSELQI
eukprot:4318720-Pleurochrysis_carterae.AAC.1